MNPSSARTRWFNRRTLIAAIVAIAVITAAFYAVTQTDQPARKVNTMAAEGPCCGKPSAPGPLMPSSTGMNEPARTNEVPTPLRAELTGPGIHFTYSGGRTCYLNTTVVDCDPWLYSDIAVNYATQAGIDPRLLLAVLTNEDCAHWCPFAHSPTAEGLRSHYNGALGIGNMHPDTFNQVAANHPDVFAGATRNDLTDPDLAVKAAAYWLADLQKELSQTLPATWPADWTFQQLVAVGYNAGAGEARRFSRGDIPPYSVAWYGNQVASNWSYITSTLCESGTYTCHS